MKKILGISLVALMSVTAANAEIASKGYVDGKDTAVRTLISNEAAARAEADTTITNTIGTIPTTGVGANSANVIEYVDAKVANANSGTTDAIADLNATVTQAASAANGQLSLQVVEAGGKLTSVTGSIAEDTYDAYGAAADAETAAKTHANNLNTAMNTRMVAAEGAIETLNGSAETEGSVAKAEADAKAYTDAQMNGQTGTLVKHTAGTAAGSATQPVYVAADGTATAITSYSYNNLTDTPTIGSGTLTVQMNGNSVGTFGANATEAATINLGNIVPAVTTTGAAGHYVLTADVDNNGVSSYQWELIERATNENAGE